MRRSKLVWYEVYEITEYGIQVVYASILREECVAERRRLEELHFDRLYNIRRRKA